MQGCGMNDEVKTYSTMVSANSAQLMDFGISKVDLAYEYSKVHGFEKVANENGERDRRFRIEHAQHIAPENLNEMYRHLSNSQSGTVLVMDRYGNATGIIDTHLFNQFLHAQQPKRRFNLFSKN